MQFNLVRTDYGLESETDDKGNYSVNITLALAPIDNDLIPPFSKDIVVVSNNSMTGYEVDKQRNKEITDFMGKINS
jgi:hypothetical protein